jgi:RNA polymerase sigma-70 factor (ECF subfamily)
MVTKHNLDCFHEFTAKFIRSKVRQLIGRAGFKEADRHDLLQDFALDLLQRRKSFNPEAANWDAFVVVVCENRYATILEHQKAKMRSRQRESGSLNHPMREDHGDGTEIGATIPDFQHGRRAGQRRRLDEEAVDLVLDTARVLESLPPHLRQLCEELKRCDSISIVARRMRISRNTVYRRMTQIRQRFEQYGMRDYL